MSSRYLGNKIAQALITIFIVLCVNFFLFRIMPWVHLDTRYIAVMDRTQSTPREMPAVALPKTVFRDASVTSYVDLPADRSAYYYNPLVPLWHRFRGSQVVAYLSHFDRLVRDSCLANVDTYIHQITPFTNPSWDANKFAVDASLKLFDRARLGVGNDFAFC